MSLPVSFRDYFEANQTQDPHLRRMKFSVIAGKVEQARAQVQQRKMRLTAIEAEKKASELDERIKRLGAEVDRDHTARLQEQARENNLYRGHANRTVY